MSIITIVTLLYWRVNLGNADSPRVYLVTLLNVTFFLVPFVPQITLDIILKCHKNVLSRYFLLNRIHFFSFSSFLFAHSDNHFFNIFMLNIIFSSKHKIFIAHNSFTNEKHPAKKNCWNFIHRRAIGTSDGKTETLRNCNFIFQTSKNNF